MLPPLSTNGIPVSVVWAPIEGTSQELAIGSPCDVTLYTGSRGPGKSDTQLMYFRQFVGQGYGRFWRGVIFDRQYKNLDDLVSKSKRWFPQFEDGAEFKESKADYKWVWPTGEELLFRSAETVADYYNFHGQEYPFIGWNELTTYPNLELFDMMMSCNRSSYTPAKDGFIGGVVPDSMVPHEVTDEDGNRYIIEPGVPVSPEGLVPRKIPLRVFATTNPFGAGHHAVKRRFIDAAEYGKVVRVETPLFNPATKKNEIVVRTQVAIFGSWRENKYLDPKYVAVLLNDSDPNRRAAWERGSWDILAGGPLDDVWNRSTHIVPRFPVPPGWSLDMAFDWGSSEPFAWQLWAESNGEEVELPGGGKIWFPAGTLIQVSELYGTEVLGSNIGLRWSPRTIARCIQEHLAELYREGWISGTVEPGPADNQIRNENPKDDGTVETIEDKFNEEGVYFERSDKSPGSRVRGLELMRERLVNLTNREGPGIAFMRNCVASHTTIPTLPRSDKVPNDTMSKGVEDHCWDACRYRVLKGNYKLATEIPVSFPR